MCNVKLLVLTLLFATVINFNLLFAAVKPDSVSVKKFIIRSQILLLNKKPDPEVIETELSQFFLAKDFTAEKTSYTRKLISDDGFIKNIFYIYNTEYLQGIDEEIISINYYAYKAVLSNESMADIFDIISRLVDKLYKLKNALVELKEKKISISEVQKRFMDNKFYDEKNMGTDNLINSSFMYLFYRLPTHYELEESKKIAENFPGNLFGQIGSGKDTYWNIIFNSAEYKEGQVVYWYQKLLYRQPTKNEIIQHVYADTFDIELLITKLITSYEFANF